MAVMAMFPLGSVLVPGATLPLQIFEERYLRMMRDCLDATPHEFGVVLIERGSEVGGGDHRGMIGTVATMLQLAELGDNRFLVVTVGSRRIRVNAWLPDDPYPLADVDELPDVWPNEWLAGGQDAVESQLAALHQRLGPITARVRRSAALALELGDPGSDTSATISDDPLLASYQLMTMAPIGSADSYRLLAAPGPFERIGMLEAMLDDVEAMLQFRLADDGYDPDDLDDLDDLDGPDDPDDPDRG